MTSVNRDEHSDIIEALENLEQSLIEFEDALEGGGEADSLIHISFRYAHNLKSSLAMTGKEHSSELIHTVENHFDLLRSGKVEPSAELVDKALESIDMIKANLFREEETEEEIRRLIGDFAGLIQTAASTAAEGGEKPALHGTGMPLTGEQRSKAEKLVQEGQRLFRIDKLIKSGIDRQTFKNLPIYEDVAEAGTFIASRPDYEDLDTSRDETVLKILFTSGQGQEELFYSIFDPFQEVSLTEAPSRPPAPAAEAAPDAVPERPAEKEKAKEEGLRLLVVEDDFVTRHLEISLLSSYGVCEVAVNGKEAVSAFELRSLEEKPYDCIFLDIMIPELDGHAVLKRIRDFESERGVLEMDRTKIIIISGLRDMDTITKSFRGQTDSYIVKPVTRKKIELELRRLGLL